MANLMAVHKVEISDGNEAFLVTDYQSDENLRLTILDVGKCEAFCGQISNTELKALAANIRMNFSSFIELTKKALTQNDYDGLQFLYCLEKNCQGFVFKWKSVDSDETKVTIGVINVFESEYKFVISEILSHLSKELFKLNQKVLHMESDLSTSQKEKNETQNLLDEVIHVKEKVEFELYSKFILLLNEKKRKIRELSHVSDKKPLKRTKISASKMSKKFAHQISDSDSDTVDDIGNRDIRTLKTLDCDEADLNEAGPSNVNCDDSLIFLDDEPKVVISPSKIRNRKTTNVSAIVNELPQHIQATCNQIYDSDSDDLLGNM